MSTRKRTLILVIVLVLAVCFVFSLTATAPARTLNGAISGLVLDPAGKAVRGVEVQVWQHVWRGYNGADWSPYLSGVTGRSGAYKITVPPGTYRVWFKPSALDTYCMEAYPDAAIPDWGDDVVVRAGRTTARISVTLDGNPGTIEGRVYDASLGGAEDPGAWLPNIPVQLAIQQNAIINTEFGATVTDKDGYYRFYGLKAFMWGIWANPQHQGGNPDYIELPLLDDVWTEYGAPKAVNADLEPVGFVSVRGRLVGPVPGDPSSWVSLAGIEVIPFFFEWWEPQWFDDESRKVTTGENGVFEMANLPTGQYMFFEYGNETYWERFYNGWNESGEVVTVERGHTVALGDWDVPLRAP